MARVARTDPKVLEAVCAAFDPPVLAFFAGFSTLLCQPPPAQQGAPK